MKNSEWQQKTFSLAQLYNKVPDREKPVSMLAWLRLAGVIPLTVEWRRGNRLPNTNLDPESIPAGYLAEVARDWDAEGYTTASEFLQALRFEIKGTKEKQAVNEVLDGLVTA